MEKAGATDPLIFGLKIMAIGLAIGFVLWLIARYYDKKKYKQDLEDTHITHTKIIAVNGVEPKSRNGALTRGIVGSLVAGEPGFWYGVLSAKDKSGPTQNIYTFLVYYDDRPQKIEKVRESSARFKTLLNKLDEK